MKKNNGDDPYHSICVNIQLKHGDIVVAGSDGLFDNVFTQEILITVQDALKQAYDDIFSLPKLFA